LPDNEGYAGSFESLTLTIAAGEGVTISCFWSPDEMPLVGALLPGRTKGLTIGYGVGGGASVSYNQTEFTKIWSSFEQQAP